MKRKAERTMKAQLLTKHGNEDSYSFQHDVAVPEVGKGDVLVRVAACGVNNTDIWTREGAYAQEGESGWQALQFPRIQGADVVGTVEEVGAGVDTGLVGQRVMVYPAICGDGDITDCKYVGSEVDGGFAEFCKVPHSNVFPVPDSCSLSDTDLASFATASMTALHMVNRVALQAGQSVVITGASGGVGTALVQLCKLRGATVIAVVGNEDKAAQLRDLGADATVLRTAPSLTSALVAANNGKPVDAVLDNVAGDQLMDLLNALRPRGKYASAGAIANPWVRVHWPTVYLKHLDILGCMLATHEEFGELVRLVVGGRLKPLVAKVFPLADLPQAQLYFKQKAFFGKLVIEC